MTDTYVTQLMHCLIVKMARKSTTLSEKVWMCSLHKLVYTFVYVTIISIISSNYYNGQVDAFAVAPINSSKGNNNNILILDHININHECGRHDWLKSFYFDFLKCAVDPRKEENILKGRKTIWANIGAHQFHLPEGKPDAQVLDGVITLCYQDLDALKNRYLDVSTSLKGSKFSMQENLETNRIHITDPWGSQFVLEASSSISKDVRGVQNGDASEGLCIRDLKFYVPMGTNLAGIARFYEQIMGAATDTTSSPASVIVDVGPGQTLTFLEHNNSEEDNHVDLRSEPETVDEGKPFSLSNYGPHISMYVRDIRQTFQRANKFGLDYVNPRFSRRAYNEEEVVKDCMFRCIDIIDPENVGNGPIVKIEHEIRSVVKKDGSKYKSCPFKEIPDGCVV